MANIRDFAVGLVLTAPSPKNSGTTLTLRAGEGSTMPTPPFYVTATPPGQLTTTGTSEKLLVTNVSGDTLTITRAQSPTTAKNIDANWTVANAMYVDDVYQSNIVVDEKLTGTINGTNTVFTTSSAFSSIQVYKNGVAMHKTDDFTVTGTNQITFVTAPATGANLIATYITGSQVMINGSNSLISDETPVGTVNGTNAVFTTSKPYIANSLQVFINGVRQKRTTHFTETTPASGTFTVGGAPLTGDDIMVSYQYVQSVSGNADTVDGYHASATPTANTIPVLDSNSKLPISLFSNPYKFMAYRGTNQSITANTNTKIQFSTEVYDDNNDYNNTTYRYTAPITGVYFLNAVVQTLNGTSTTDNNISLYKNGTPMRKGGNLKAGQYPQHQIIGQFRLNAGDYVEVYFINIAAGDTIEGSSTSSTFEGHLVCI